MLNSEVCKKRDEDACECECASIGYVSYMYVF